MRAIIHDGKTVTNTIELPDDWTGASGEWQPADGEKAVAHDSAQIGWPVDKGVPVEPTAAAADLDQVKAFARAQIIARANAFTAPILSRYPDAERSGWDKREAEARAILAADDKAAAIAETDIIKALATAAGEDTAATVVRAEAIIAKATQFAAISAAVEVMRDQALTSIDAVEDAADMPTLLASLDAQATVLAQAHGLA